jgi:hypothetical protein
MRERINYAPQSIQVKLRRRREAVLSYKSPLLIKTAKSPKNTLQFEVIFHASQPDYVFLIVLTKLSEHRNFALKIIEQKRKLSLLSHYAFVFKFTGMKNQALRFVKEADTKLHVVSRLAPG